jgi:hypothetical protein
VRSSLAHSRRAGRRRDPYALPIAASLFGLSESEALVFLFVILPFAVAGLVIAFVSWRSSHGPQPLRTSQILAEGLPGEARVVSVKMYGGFLDPRPMVRIGLQVTAGVDGTPFDLDVVQSLPKDVFRRLRPGETVAVRLTPDRTAGAIVWQRGDDGGW